MHFGPVYKDLFSPKSGMVFSKIQKMKKEMTKSSLIPHESELHIMSSLDSHMESEELNKARVQSD